MAGQGHVLAVAMVGRVRATPVSVLVMVIEALATAAPVGSVTVPTMVASWASA